MTAEWNEARSPNYEINVDKMYPYSEFPFEKYIYKTVKIPFCINNLIEHVCYFGQGKVETSDGCIGFPDCYNVNCEYSLVEYGADKGRKIPNRIPYRYQSTDIYIKNNSVLTVTVPLYKDLIKENLVRDITRIVNSDSGKVILYGANDSQKEMIGDELKKAKQLFYCPIYVLPENLQLSYFYTSYAAYLSLNELKKELYRHVYTGDFEAAIILTGCLTNVYCGDALDVIVKKLINDKIKQVIIYAYKLWITNARDVVCKHFPTVFKQIFNGDCLAIINKRYNQALVLEPETMLASGESYYSTSNNVAWKIIPVWDNDNVVFKLYNVKNEKYLQFSPVVDDNGDRKASGSHNSKLQKSGLFSLEPLMVNNQVAFTIASSEDDKLHDLSSDLDSCENTQILGRKCGSVDKEEHCKWILAVSCDTISNAECETTDVGDDF